MFTKINLNYENLTMEDKYNLLNETAIKCNNCFKCVLSQSRTQAVFGDGNSLAELMLIGEAPGQQEDAKGKPFVGRSGQLLDKFLLSENITREKNIYICNTVKCRPPDNRAPKTEEKAACKEYLEVQLQVIRPKLILLCGATAVKSFIDTKLGISKIRGQLFDGPLDSKMMPIFHPSYLLRNHSMEEGSPRWLMQQDIKAVKHALEQF